MDNEEVRHYSIKPPIAIKLPPNYKDLNVLLSLKNTEEYLNLENKILKYISDTGHIIRDTITPKEVSIFINNYVY